MKGLFGKRSKRGSNSAPTTPTSSSRQPDSPTTNTKLDHQNDEVTDDTESTYYRERKATLRQSQFYLTQLTQQLNIPEPNATERRSTPDKSEHDEDTVDEDDTEIDAVEAFFKEEDESTCSDTKSSIPPPVTEPAKRAARGFSIVQKVSDVDFSDRAVQNIIAAFRDSDHLKLKYTLEEHFDQLIQPIPILNGRNVIHLAFQYGIKQTDRRSPILKLDISDSLTIISSTTPSLSGSFTLYQTYEQQQLHLVTVVTDMVRIVLDICQTYDKTLDELLLSKDETGLTPFHYLACHDNLYRVLESIDEFITIPRISAIPKIEARYVTDWIVEKNLKKRIHETLNLSAIIGNLKYVQLLYHLGIDVNGHDENDETALHRAAAGGHLQTAEFLMKHGAYVDISYFTNKLENWTPLCDAILHNRPEMVQLLIKKNADFTRKVKNKKLFGNQPLTAVSLASIAGNTELMQYFLDKGVNAGNAIYWAACSNNMKVLKHIVENLRWKVDIPNKDDHMKSPLHIAIEKGQMDAAQYLVAKVPKLLREVDKHGNSALHYAALYTGEHSTKLIELLMYHGADTTLRNSSMKTPVDVCSDRTLALFLEKERAERESIQQMLPETVKRLMKRVEALEKIAQTQNELIERQNEVIREQAERLSQLEQSCRGAIQEVNNS